MFPYLGNTAFRPSNKSHILPTNSNTAKLNVPLNQCKFFARTIDNPSFEARLHGLHEGSETIFHEDHILAVHRVHRPEPALAMGAADLRELAPWLGMRRE